MGKFSYTLFLGQQFGGKWHEAEGGTGYWATLPSTACEKLTPFLTRYCVPHLVEPRGAESRITLTGSLGTLTDLCFNLEEEKGKPVREQIFGKPSKPLFR